MTPDQRAVLQAIGRGDDPQTTAPGQRGGPGRIAYLLNELRGNGWIDATRCQVTAAGEIALASSSSSSTHPNTTAPPTTTAEP